MPLRWELRQQFPGYEVQQYNIIVDTLGGWSQEIAGNEHYNEGNCGEQKERGVEQNAEGGGVGYAQ